MKKRWIAGLLIAVSLPVAAAFTPVGQMAFYGARAWLSSKDHFTQCTPDPRIWCEPGAEAFGAAIAPLLPAAIGHDERAFGMAYVAPVRVNVYASDESFSRYGAVAPRAAGVVVLGDVHLAPKMQAWATERREAIVTHELAHLHLVQRIGMSGIGKLPNWFWEGLPTYLSGGGGAGNVTREEAVQAFVHGRHMVPEDEGSLFAPKQAPSYGLAHAMYYRQASVLVAWMDERDPAAFKRLLAAVGRGDAFAGAVSGAYGRPLAALWAEFQRAMRAEILNKPSGSA
ncbi:hypothetical protein [Pseudoduganella sp. R-43]|uniref:hypothetical protein n=1 Tax=unclassified Pseudoduganella TaxID=2637179 RepID=UPI003CF31B26